MYRLCDSLDFLVKTKMSDDIPIYGLDKELAEKRAGQYDVGLETQARTWIEEVIGETVEGDFLDALKDGTVLVKYTSAQHIDP